jgi:hypothetical protein
MIFVHSVAKKPHITLNPGGTLAFPVGTDA